MFSKKNDFYRIFFEVVKKPVQEAVWLRDHSHFRIGGPADYFFEATSAQELKSSIRVAREWSVPHYVIGGGSNLLFDDEGFRGLIIKNRVKGMKLIAPAAIIEVFSGTLLAELVQFSEEEGLEGFEFLAGIPGTVGGAVFGNAGAFGQNIGDFLKEAILLDKEGKESKVNQDYFAFAYRQSCLRQKHDILLKAQFALKHGERGRVRARVEENLEVRRKKHPPQETACAGSYFRNPVLPDGKKVAAGHLLEQVGARNLKVGGASVYSGHCNFLLNENRATAQDILRLAEELKIRVKEKFGVELEEEVIFLPAASSKL